MRQRHILLLATTAALCVLPTPATAATITVGVTAENTFTPSQLEVTVGDTVEFDWTGGFHDVSFSDGANSGTPVADLGVNYSRTFDAPGTYEYICTVHQGLGMTGTVIAAAADVVTDDAGATDDAAAADTTTSETTDDAAPTTERALPFTGPEDRVGWLAGLVLLALGGLGLLLDRRTTSP